MGNIHVVLNATLIKTHFTTTNANIVYNNPSNIDAVLVFAKKNLWFKKKKKKKLEKIFIIKS